VDRLSKTRSNEHWSDVRYLALLILVTAAVFAAMVWGLLYLGRAIGDSGLFHPAGTPKTCAEALGIHWTPEDGATERLNAYDACVTGELRP
jgi:hypothetical protein